MLRLFIGVVSFVVFSGTAWAGSDWDGLFANNLNDAVTVSKTDSHCWYAKGFDSSPTIQAGAQATIDSEVNFGPFFCDLSTDYYLDFQVVMGTQVVATGKLTVDCPILSHCTCHVAASPSKTTPVAVSCGADGKTRNYVVSLGYAPSGSIQAVAAWAPSGDTEGEQSR